MHDPTETWRPTGNAGEYLCLAHPTVPPFNPGSADTGPCVECHRNPKRADVGVELAPYWEPVAYLGRSMLKCAYHENYLETDAACRLCLAEDNEPGEETC